MATATVTTLWSGATAMAERAALLQLMRLSSAALPIGAFAYSQGLEQAVEAGTVHDESSAGAWLGGMLDHALLTCDLPLLLRLHEAWAASDDAAVQRWNAFLYSTRPSRELREEELQLGRALARLLVELGIPRAEPFRRSAPVTLAALYALAAVEWQTGAEPAALAYGFAWAEAQVGAATRLIPLGQSQAQRVLSRALTHLEQGFDRARLTPDDAIAASTPGQTLLSMQHETQYSRLFRS
jgi:urease accessory protein